MAVSSKSGLDNVVTSARSATGQQDMPEREATELQLLQLRDELIGAEAKLGELREQVERLKARCQRTEELCELRVANVENELALSTMYKRQLEMVLESTSWRVGRAIVKPTYALRRVLGSS